jgi:hypothetical protein
MDGNPDLLLERQNALQEEVESVVSDLGLEDRLRQVGRPVRVGSAALGLMVWRDLDVTVVCENLKLAPVVDLGGQLALHPRTRRVEFRNDTGVWNTQPGYPDGLYLGLGYRSPAGNDWKLDVWFVDDPDRQPDLAHLRTLPPRIDRGARLAILRIKTMWYARPEYGRTVRSFDIYTAVLDGGVRTPEQFDDWIAALPSS